MSSSEVAQGAPVGAAPEGAQSPEAVQEVVTATTEDATPAATEPTPEEKAKKQRDERLAGLAFEAREAKRREKAAEERAAALEAELQAAREGKGGAPKEEDFESYTDFLRAVTKWELQQELGQREKSRTDEQKKAKQIEEQTRKAARLETVVSAGAETFKDFDTTLQALDSAIANPDDFRVGLDEILDSDVATDILYYLGKNPSVAVEMASLPPHKQARAIGSLEEKFKAKKLTAAPEPVKPLKGNGGRVTSDEPPSDPAEYRKWRAKMKG